MATERNTFGISGPKHLTTVDWRDPHHLRAVAATLVQGVYIQEIDRQLKNQESEALAPHWWNFFHFDLVRVLIDDSDKSIFGAVYEFKCSQDSNCAGETVPRYVVAFRGTLPKAGTVSQDLKLDFKFMCHKLHQTSRFQLAMQAVKDVVAATGASNIWLAGHSLGSAMAMLAGKAMAKGGILIETYLFNPPFASAPLEWMRDRKLKHGIRFTSSVLKAGVAVAVKGQLRKPEEDCPFLVLSTWVPYLFVNPADHICSEYIGYFEHRKKMEKIGVGRIERLATQNSIGNLLLGAKGPSEASHLLPSACLTINLSPAPDLRRAHGLHQWWHPDAHIQSNIYQFS